MTLKYFLLPHLEYGATTGRSRRMGWFDTVATLYGCMIQGVTEAELTLLFVLGYLDEIPVCTGYEIDGKVAQNFPVTNLLSYSKPVYTVLPGWKCDMSGIRKFIEYNSRSYPQLESGILLKQDQLNYHMRYKISGRYIIMPGKIRSGFIILRLYASTSSKVIWNP